MGRTLQRFLRLYAGGYDLSGYTRIIQKLEVDYPIDLISCLNDAVQGGLPDHAGVSIGATSCVFDNTATSGLHAVANAPAARNVMIPVGELAAPAEGNHVFCSKLLQLNYKAEASEGMTFVNIDWGKTDVTQSMNYVNPWGVLLHENSAETGANTAIGVDDYGSQTTAGGWMMYQIFAVVGTGTVTISIEDSAVNENASFAALTSATSGAIAHGSVPASGIVQLGTTDTIERYLRWQISLSTITSVSFALAFMRGR